MPDARRRSVPVLLLLTFVACGVALLAARQFHVAPAPVPKEKEAVAFDETALRKLAELLPPPKQLTLPGSAAQWRAAEKELGSAFPEEYKRIVGLYGCFSVNQYLRFSTPFGDRDNGLQSDLELLREGEKHSASLNLAHQRVWPEEGGLLPIASTVNGASLAYRTGGKPDGWTLVVLSREGEVEEHPYGLLEFMTHLADGSLDSKILLESGDLWEPLTAR